MFINVVIHLKLASRPPAFIDGAGYWTDWSWLVTGHLNFVRATVLLLVSIAVASIACCDHRVVIKVTSPHPHPRVVSDLQLCLGADGDGGEWGRGDHDVAAEEAQGGLKRRREA